MAKATKRRHRLISRVPWKPNMPRVDGLPLTVAKASPNLHLQADQPTSSCASVAYKDDTCKNSKTSHKNHAKDLK